MSLGTIEAERPRMSERASLEERGITPVQPRTEVTPEPRPGRPDAPGLLWRVLCVVIGAGLAITGWALMMTAILVFIGLPVFIFGLALMQSAES